jgi:hypothetical protein
MNWTISCRRLAPSTFLSATSRARCEARAVARLVKLTTAIPRMSRAMIAKVAMVRRSLPGFIVACCALPRWTSRMLTSFQS